MARGQQVAVPLNTVIYYNREYVMMDGQRKGLFLYEQMHFKTITYSFSLFSEKPNTSLPLRRQ